MGKIKEFVYDVAFQIVDGDWISPVDLSGDEADDAMLIDQAITEFIADEVLLVDRDAAEFLDKVDTRASLSDLIRDQLLHIDETLQEGAVDEYYRGFRADHPLDDLKANFRSWEADHETEEDAELLYSILLDRHVKFDEPYLRELAYHWVGLDILATKEDEESIDPAGGTHSGNEDDPARMYESEEENKLKEWFNALYDELINTQGLDDAEAQVLLTIAEPQLDKYFNHGELPADVAKEIVNNQQLMNDVYDMLSKEFVDEIPASKEGPKTTYIDITPPKKGDYSKMGRRELEAEIDAALERGDKEELRKISEFLPEAALTALRSRLNENRFPESSKDHGYDFEKAADKYAGLIKLKTPIIDPSGKYDYMAILTKDRPTYKEENWVFKILIRRENVWDMTPGQWYLETLIESRDKRKIFDEIYIDWGSKWKVGGIEAALEEAEREVAKMEESKESLYMPRLFEVAYEHVLRRQDEQKVEKLLNELREKFKDEPKKLKKIEQMKSYIPGRMNKFFNIYSRLMGIKNKVVDLDGWMVAYID